MPSHKASANSIAGGNSSFERKTVNWMNGIGHPARGSCSRNVVLLFDVRRYLSPFLILIAMREKRGAKGLNIPAYEAPGVSGCKLNWEVTAQTGEPIRLTELGDTNRILYRSSCQVLKQGSLRTYWLIPCLLRTSLQRLQCFCIPEALWATPRLPRFPSTIS